MEDGRGASAGGFAVGTCSRRQPVVKSTGPTSMRKKADEATLSGRIGIIDGDDFLEARGASGASFAGGIGKAFAG